MIRDKGGVMSDGLMTREEVLEIVRAKEDNLHYIQDNMGIWGMPYSSERDSLKYWREVLAGRVPMPKRSSWMN